MSDIKRKIKKIAYSTRFLPALALLLITLTVVVYSAFIGEGSKKGVLVASDYYFTSNMLTSVDSASQITTINRSCIASANGNGTAIVDIRNYNTAGRFDVFDVTYDVSFWLSEEADASNPYDYSICFDGVTSIPVTTTMQTRTFSLPAISRPNKNSFDVNFTLKNGMAPNISEAKGIRILAVPTRPSYISSYIIGATIRLADVVPGFSMAADYVFDDSCAFEDLAGFLYQITTTGSPEPGTSITISWDAVKLQMDDMNPLKASVVTGTEITDEDDNPVSRIDTVTISDIGSNELYRIAFFRAPGSEAYWATQTSTDVLDTLVTTQILGT